MRKRRSSKEKRKISGKPEFAEHIPQSSIAITSRDSLRAKLISANSSKGLSLKERSLETERFMFAMRASKFGISRPNGYEIVHQHEDYRERSQSACDSIASEFHDSRSSG